MPILLHPARLVPDELDLIALEDERAERLHRCANKQAGALHISSA
ncbi:MAG: hypothetical protein ABI339_09275 [Solirubrobacteraceae bacterium]